MSTEMVEHDAWDADKKNVLFKGFRLCFRVLSQGFEMNPVSVCAVATVLTDQEPTNAELNISS